MNPQINMTEVKKLRIWFVFAVAISMISFGCLKKEDYPNEPSITFKRIDFDAQHNATLYLDFIDGDGNFGLESGENVNLPDACVKRYNMFINPYELQNGTWVNVTDDPCISDENIPLYYAVPWAKPQGQIKTQKGEIKVNLEDFWFKSNSYDTLRFEIYIVDRDYNKSNVITTGYYLKP